MLVRDSSLMQRCMAGCRRVISHCTLFMYIDRYPGHGVRNVFCVMVFKEQGGKKWDLDQGHPGRDPKVY